VQRSAYRPLEASCAQQRSEAFIDRCSVSRGARIALGERTRECKFFIDTATISSKLESPP